MNAFKIAFLSFFSVSSLLGQNLQISGTIKNQKNEGISFATVLVLNAIDSSLVKAETATENGGFVMKNLFGGKYILSVSSVGYKKYFSPMFQLENTNLQLADIILSEENTLKELTVSATKPLVEVKADRTVFNVQGSLVSTGLSAFEVLRKSPGVSFDNNENIVLQGKTGVRIFIDGKPSILQGQDLNEFLKSLQASDIEAIELITQPSSKYDAAGNAGIINIKLKKDKRYGTNGSFSTGFAYGKFAKNNNSLTFNNRGKKVNLFGTYSNRLGKTWSFLDFYREQVNTIFDQKSVFVRDGLGQNVKAGLDYFIDSKSTFGVIINGNFNDNTNKNNSRTPISPINTGIVEQVLIADNESFTNSDNIYLNSNYKYSDTKGRVFNVDFDLGKYVSDRSSFQPNYYKNGDETQILFQNIYRMNTPTDINLLSSQMDYEQNLWKGKFSVGVKFSKVTTDNTFDFYDVIDGTDVLNQTRSNNFVYDEQIRAAFMNFSKNVKKVDFQIGLRAEQTISDGNLNSLQNNSDNRVKRNYTDLFPSGGLTYNRNQNNVYALTYSSRIERPTYQSLNPFEWQVDELTFQKGNAFLQPQYTTNIKISHTYKYTLTTSLSYSYVKDFFAQITDTLNYDRNFLMERNIADQRVIDFGVSYPYNVKKWWSVYVNVDIYHTDFRSDEVKFHNIKANVLSFYGQNSFKLPKKWNFEVSGWFGSPGIWGGTYKTKSLGSIDVALQKTFLKDKLSMRLAASDLLFTSPWRGTTTFGGLKITGSGGWESRQFRANLSYNFGNNQVKSARQRKTSLDDAKDRIN
ncbi:outer membrane beta-barrel protein [Lacihabitans soyangensis]|uniref:TonB-dependent receptor n=1 Tax=Lacihabitans soyangensis TaxID=869394 RepID=A0AAE3H091_9BACT|nr:outer membrane beta-barrel protein [Lacihabitans soyangensis]MCP9762557.1 TonB-dependent receptor [Lacihabitans soyangensis]